MKQKPETVAKVTFACCCLHNLLILERPHQYLADVAQEGNPDVQPADWHAAETLAGLQAVRGNHATKVAKATRDHLRGYFNNVGAVPWQQEMVDRVSNFKMCSKLKLTFFSYTNFVRF